MNDETRAEIRKRLDEAKPNWFHYLVAIVFLVALLAAAGSGWHYLVTAG